MVDVYRAANIAAAAVTAGRSAENGSRPMPVPDFRPGPERQRDERPQP